MFNFFKRIRKIKKISDSPDGPLGNLECVEGAYDRSCPECGSTFIEYTLLERYPTYQSTYEQYYSIRCEVKCLSCGHTWICEGEYKETIEEPICSGTAREEDEEEKGPERQMDEEIETEVDEEIEIEEETQEEETTEESEGGIEEEDDL